MKATIFAPKKRIKRRGKILYSLIALMSVVGLLPLFLPTG